jgi:5-hydroxyisourate hydrolase
MSTISTHVLDTAAGHPAEGLPIALEARRGDEWIKLGGGTTNDDGRVRDLLGDGKTLELGVYRMTFSTGVYFDKHDIEGFYPVVRVVFEIQAPDEHYHVPLLLSPYGYSTYRGS